MPYPCHIIVEGNPAFIYASRGGEPKKVLPILSRFLEKFWEERETSGMTIDTPECLVAQIIVRFGFETAEDDFSNLRVGVKFNPEVSYLYYIGSDRQVGVWEPSEKYRQDPSVGLAGCQTWNYQPAAD